MHRFTRIFVDEDNAREEIFDLSSYSVRGFINNTLHDYKPNQKTYKCPRIIYQSSRCSPYWQSIRTNDGIAELVETSFVYARSTHLVRDYLFSYALVNYNSHTGQTI